MGQATPLGQIDYSKYNIASPFETDRKRLPAGENPRLCRFSHCEEFTTLSELWKKGELPETPTREIRDIKKTFFQIHPDIPAPKLEEVWDELEKRFMHNPGFASYFTRFCLRSEWYPRWPLNVPTARAVVGPFGWGWHLDGHFGKIPILDDHAWWTEHHPILRYIRERGKNSAFLVAEQHANLEAKNQLSPSHKQHICVLSAGYIPWLTMLNYRADPMTQEIMACDMDPTMTPAILEPFSDHINSAVNYHNCRNEALFNQESLRESFDIVLMDGGFIYYPPPYRDSLLDAALGLLHKGGLFVYDNQCEHWAMKFAQTLFDWGETTPIYLAKTPEAIKASVEQYTKDRPVSAKLYYDRENDTPVGATIVLKKH